jgi:hypothetical protein
MEDWLCAGTAWRTSLATLGTLPITSLEPTLITVSTGIAVPRSCTNGEQCGMDWVVPGVRGLAPFFEQWKIDRFFLHRKDLLILLVSWEASLPGQGFGALFLARSRPDSGAAVQ